MGIRTLKPTSPARRYMTFLTNEEITKKTPEKSLLRAKGNRTNGRNAYGRITVRHRGGGASRIPTFVARPAKVLAGVGVALMIDRLPQIPSHIAHVQSPVVRSAGGRLDRKPERIAQSVCHHRYARSGGA